MYSDESPLRASDELTVAVVLRPDPDDDAEAADRAARRLRAELAELDVSVSAAPGEPPPPGAKGDAATLAALVVALSAAGGVLPTLIQTIGGWVGRQQADRSVSVSIGGDTLTLGRASGRQQEQLVEAFLRRHGAG